MDVRKAKDIEQLFREVKEYDLVLTSEASLADALNNRLENPVLGHFATTPMLYVLGDYQNKELAKERDLFLETVKNTDLSWKKASYLVGNIVNCWRETGDPEEILEYERFSEGEVGKALEVIEDTENAYTSMMEAEATEEDVAVINYHQMNELDKKVLPESFDRIETFVDERTELPDFKLYSSTSEIVNELKESISEDTADDVAIVADPDSEYTVLAKTALREEGIPYLSQESFRDGEGLRTFIRLLRLGLTDDRLLVKDCRGVIRSLGFEVPRKYQNDYLQQTDRFEDFRELLNKVSGSRLSYILDRFEERNGDMDEVRKMLEEAELLRERVNHDTLSRLEYYLDSYEVDSESKGEGVLFVSPRSQAYVDKPVVFFLVMDSSWTVDVGDEPWIDQDGKEETNLKNFKSLIQSGEQQHYLVEDRKLNQDITPCLYFNELVDEDLESFRDLEHRDYGSDAERNRRGFERMEKDGAIEEVETISKSSLDRFVQSPRQYFFDKVLEEPRQDYFIKGNLFHDFAEFYLNHPDYVEKRGLDVFVGQIVRELEIVTDEVTKELLEREIEIGMRNLKNFIDDRIIENGGFEEAELEGVEQKWNDNHFAEVFDKGIEKEITEARFENRELGINGFIDLLVSDSEIVDHKSSKRKKSASKIVKNSNLELVGSEPDFQALLYLTQLRSMKPGERLEFSFFHFLSNAEEVMDGEDRLDETLTTINYYPCSFKEHMMSREFFEYLLTNQRNGGKLSENNGARKILENILGYEGYREFFSEREVPVSFDGDIEDIGLYQELVEKCEEIKGSTDITYVNEKSKTILNKIIKRRQSNFFKEDLDAFEEFVPEQLEKLNTYKREGFPVENPFYEEELDLDELDDRDLIMR